MRSIDNGGTKTLVEASSDGTGVFIDGNGLSDNQFQPDNSAYNSLVFKYAEEADNSGLSLSDYVIQENTNNPGTISQKDLNYANQLKQDTQDSGLIPVDGTLCDDNNIETSGDKYINGICQGYAMIMI